MTLEERRAYNAKKTREWRARNHSSILSRWREKRLAVLKKMGGKCVRCGFSDWRALQIDHKKGGGNALLRTYGPKRLLDKAMRDSRGLQLLCSNCNWIKRYERGEHGAAQRRRV